MHLFGGVFRREVAEEDVAVALEGRVQDGDGAFDDGAVFEAVDVPGVDDVDALAGLGTSSVARYTFRVDRLFLGRARSDAGSVVLQKMLRTFPNAGRAIRVLSVWIGLPGVGCWVVLLHRWTLLLALAIVVKVLAGQAVALFGPATAPGAKQVTALARVGPETAALPTLGRAVGFGEVLTVVLSFAPASLLAAPVALGTCALGQCEAVVLVQVLSVRVRYDLVPVYRVYVTQVVIVEHAHVTVQHVCGK